MSGVTVRVAVLLAIWLMASAPGAAAQEPLSELSLEELMQLDAGRVYGASERLQPVTEAPASVSFITAEEIARHGYKTLADILRGVRGMYVTDDRNFSLVGARGFGRPGDYNSRILLLVNGHRVNDNIFGQAEIGAEFGMDPALFERVEIIRGPASSLYGDSAFFGVINVITKSGATLDGVSLNFEDGSLGTRMARLTAGRRFSGDFDVAAGITYGQSDGVKRLYFPEFNTTDNNVNNGIAENLDDEQFTQLYGQLSTKRLRLTLAYGWRTKDVPTASFGTVFNDQAHPEQTTDRHTLADLEYTLPIKRGHLSLRASFDQFSVDGHYPLITDGPATLNSVLGSRWSAEARWQQPLPGRQVLTVGTEYIDNIHQDQSFANPNGDDPPPFDVKNSSRQDAAYVQDEVRVFNWLIANAGLRYDQYDTFERVTPRAAVIVMPSAAQSFKYLFGNAFRAPSEYERNTYIFGEGAAALGPETIDTHELVWERYTNDWLRTSVSGYWYKADGLIIQLPMNSDAAAVLHTTHINGGHVRAKGIEFEGQMRLGGGVHVSASYALQRAEDEDLGTRLPNSPQHMEKVRLNIPIPWRHLLVSPEVQSMSSRTTRLNDLLSPVTLTNLTVVLPLGRVLELRGVASNLFNVQYLDPVSDDHLQDAILQNGRTARIGFTYKFGRK
jgi:outer membrane receptor for ferrienterochelin and colicins